MCPIINTKRILALTFLACATPALAGHAHGGHGGHGGLEGLLGPGGLRGARIGEYRDHVFLFGIPPTIENDPLGDPNLSCGNEPCLDTNPTNDPNLSCGRDECIQ